MSGGITAAVVGGVSAISGMSAASKAGKAQDKATAAASASADRTAQLAEDQWNRYLDVYGPLEDQQVSEAQNLGSEANKTKMAQEAAGAVTSSYAGLRAKLNSTPGLDPSSQKYLDTLSKVGLSEAATSAAAQTGARRDAEAAGRTAVANATALGKGLPGQALAGMSSANSALSGVTSQANGMVGQARSDLAGAARMFGDAVKAPGLGAQIGGLFSSTPQTTVSHPDAYWKS